MTWDQRGLRYVATSEWLWFLWAPVLGRPVVVRLLQPCSLAHSMSLSRWFSSWCSLVNYLFPCLVSASLLLSKKLGCRESCFALFMQYLRNLAQAKHLTSMCRINNWFNQCLINVPCESFMWKWHYCCPGLGGHFSQWFQRCLMTMNLNLTILVLPTLALVIPKHFPLFTLSPYCNLLQWSTASRSYFQSPCWPLASPKQAVTTK